MIEPLSIALLSLIVLLCWAWLRERAAGARALSEKAGALESQLAALRTEASDLRVRAARLERDLEAERTASTDKLKLVESSQAQLAATFRALSAEALEQQSAQLLQLAHERFGAQQTAARGELELQKQAVEQLVLPIRDSLQ